MHWQSLALLLSTTITTTLAAKASPGCGKAPTVVTPDAGTKPLSVTVGGRARSYYVKLPANYDNTHPYRLIFTLHALGGTAQQVTVGTGGYLPYYGLPSLINDTVGAIYVAPDGISNGWQNTGNSDVNFISTLVKTLNDDLCIDENLRFSTGFSYGSAMSYAIACSLAKDFRAVAALSGNPSISGCTGGNDPIAYYGQHGVSDQVLPIAGGRQMRDRFVKNNKCTAVTAQEPAAGSGKHIKTVYQGCDPKYPVVWVAFDGPHTPQPTDAGTTTTFSHFETWEFFKQFT
ncbi:carbohydrate esterase family 1 protein [Periconia macrospinosa]|uniref:feruloyl esterase n=1 Tax=Periconia macrospinosa TaxID=97972 RepID=A0A2V1E6X2_9PLEO|nr:carbohydrate esterase family 1 protein [Periconia macrospinosa]